MMKEQKGITLVALVITIIVMLILVAVSVTVALRGGLFDQARDAKSKWEANQATETNANFVTYNVDGTNFEGNDAINAAVNGVE